MISNNDKNHQGRRQKRVYRDRTPKKSHWKDAGLVLFGCLLCGISFNALVRPNGLAPGGLPGLAVILGHFAPISPSIFIAVVNLVLLGVAWVVLGRGFALRTLSGSVLFPLAIQATAFVSPMVKEHLLAALVGGALLGLGIGIVFQGKSTVGGFSTLAIILQRKRGIPVDRSLLFFDAMVLLGALAFLPVEAALSAIVCSYVLAKTARATLTGPSTAQMAWVVSDRAATLREHVLHEVDLGVTVVPARGGYTGRAKDLLLVVMQPSDVPRFKAAVKQLDPTAFVVLAEAGEVLGYGFAPHH